jgi:hypothetical protein
MDNVRCKTRRRTHQLTHPPRLKRTDFASYARPSLVSPVSLPRLDGVTSTATAPWGTRFVSVPLYQTSWGTLRLLSSPLFVNMPVNLPINPFQIDSTPSNAYDVCLMIEGRASEASDTRGHKPSELVCARLLGYMLIHAPVDTGRDYLAKVILSCTDDDGLKRLGKFYFDHFIRLCAYSLPMQ